MAGIGARLRMIRQQWGLSLREVEQRSRSLARERGDPSFQVSAGWLARLEGDGHESTVNKLIALAEIYGIPIDQLLGSNDVGYAELPTLDQLPNLSAPKLPFKGSRKSRANHLLSVHHFLISRLMRPRSCRKRMYRLLRHIGEESSAGLI
jgi:transcriptional regulator with XRE-family HTH domain